jgi:DNA-binding NtrC family response regulator
VRELQNCIERGVVLARTEVVELSDLLLPSARATSSEHDSGPSPHEPLHAFLDRMASVRIRAALEANRGARQAAARELGIERTTLYRLLKKYDMED